MSAVENAGDVLAEMRAAIHDPDGKIAIVPTFTHGDAIRVYKKTRKIGPLLFPAKGQTLGQTLDLLLGEEP